MSFSVYTWLFCIFNIVKQSLSNIHINELNTASFFTITMTCLHFIPVTLTVNTRAWSSTVASTVWNFLTWTTVAIWSTIARTARALIWNFSSGMAIAITRSALATKAANTRVGDDLVHLRRSFWRKFCWDDIIKRSWRVFIIRKFSRNHSHLQKGFFRIY